MNNFGMKIAVGIGDALFISAALTGVIYKYDSIYINPRWELSEIFKNNKDYNIFYKELVKAVFNHEKFIIDDPNVSYPYITMIDIVNSGIKPQQPRLANVLTKKPALAIDGDYIVVTTKVREYDINNFLTIKNKFIDVLKELSKKYKIVIMGEREVESNYEYTVHGKNHIYSIYRYIKSIPNIIDITVPCLGITVPDFNKLKEDCYIMNKSKAVITIGCGGNLSLAMSVSDNTISLRKDGHTFVSMISDSSNTFNSTDKKTNFLEMIKKI